MNGRRKVKRWAGRILLMLAALLVLELCARGLYRNVTTTAQWSYFTANWVQSGAVRTNRFGFREREFPAAPPDERVRICAIGDSFLFGQGVPEPERFSNILEERLNADSPRFEVLNFGEKGANLREHLRTLRETVLPLHPDAILLQWFVNDPDPEEGAYPAPPRLLPWKRADRFLTRHSALWSLMNIAWERLAVAVGLRNGYWEYTAALLADENSPPAMEARRLLGEFVEECRSRRIDVAVVLFPDLGVDVGPDYPLGFLMDRTAAQCADLGIICVDLRTVYGSLGPDQWPGLWVNRLDTHPSAYANQLAADAVLQRCGHAWNTMAEEPKRP